MPNFLLCFTLAGIGLLSTAPVAALSVYKYVDEAGRVTYSESAPAKSARLRIVNIDPDANALTFERPRAVGAPGSGASGGATNDDVIARLAQELAQRVANTTAPGVQPSGAGISRNQLSARDRFLIQQAQTNANAATGPTSQNTGNTGGANTAGATDAGGTGMGGGAGTGGVITGTTGNNNANATVNPLAATGSTPNIGTPSQGASPQNPTPSSATATGATTSNASGTTTLNSNSPTFGSAGTGSATFSNSDSTFTSGSPTFTSNSPTFGPGASMGSVDLSGGNNLGGGIATGSNVGNASGSGTVNPGTVSPFGGNSSTATTTGTGGTSSTGSSDGFSNTSGFSDTTGFSDTSGFSDTTGFGAPSGGGTTASDRGGVPKGGSGAGQR